MEELHWNLEGLFSSEEAFSQEIDQVKKEVEKLQQEDIQITDQKTLLYWLDRKWNLKERANTLLVYGSLCYYRDVKNETRIQERELVESLQTEVDLATKKIDGMILSLGKETVLEEMKKEKAYQKYYFSTDCLFRMQEHLVKAKDQDQFKENQKRINQLLTEYNQLLREMEFPTLEVDGKEITLTPSNCQKYFSARDRETRKKAFFCVSETYQEKAEKYAEILNEIKSLRLENAHLEGYQTLLEKELFVENLKPNMIDTLIQLVHENLLVIQKYFGLKAQTLGVLDPHLYDLSAPLNDSISKKYTMEEAIQIIREALKPLGEKYLNVVDLLLDGHIDATVDEKKHQSITFSWHMYSFMNFRGSYIDLKNLIHELGHIVNYYLSHQEQPYLYEDSTVFVGETASIVNEILLNRYLYHNAETKDEKCFYLNKSIENYFSSIFKQTLYTELELYMESHPDFDEESLSIEYEKLTKEYYGSQILYDENTFTEWARKGQLYRWDYYCYKYATGLLMASAVVHAYVDQKSLKEEDYIHFLSAGSSKYSLDLLKMIQIDWDQPENIYGGFEVLKQDVHELEKILK